MVIGLQIGKLHRGRNPPLPRPYQILKSPACLGLTDLVAKRRAYKQASADASLIYIANMLRSRPVKSLRSIQERKFGTDLDNQESSVNFRKTAEDFAVIKHWNRILQLPLWKGMSTQKT